MSDNVTMAIVLFYRWDRIPVMLWSNNYTAGSDFVNCLKNNEDEIGNILYMVLQKYSTYQIK